MRSGALTNRFQSEDVIVGGFTVRALKSLVRYTNGQSDCQSSMVQPYSFGLTLPPYTTSFSMLESLVNREPHRMVEFDFDLRPLFPSLPDG